MISRPYPLSRSAVPIMILTLAHILLAIQTAQADRRKYAFTYGFTTIPAEASELEFYQTTRIAPIDSWEYRVELEHGITDQTDFSIYQIFTQKEEQSFLWEAVQLRLRHKLAEQGTLPLDPLIYIEYNRKIDLKRQNKLEGKLILARDFGELNLALNPLYEFFWAPGEPVHELGMDAGVSFEFSPRFSLGVESVTRYEISDDKTETAAYLGPAFSFASGDVYYTVAYIAGLTDESDDARIRLLFGVGL